jgi:hypothetical protein
MNNRHRVRTHHWRNGFLKSRDSWFDDLVKAIEYALGIGCDSYKIYDGNGVVVKSGGGVTPDTEYS